MDEKKQPNEKFELTQGSIYNTIPEEMKIKVKPTDSTVVKEDPKKIETILKADDLFGSNDLFAKMDKKEVKVNFQGFSIQTYSDDEEKPKKK